MAISKFRQKLFLSSRQRCRRHRSKGDGEDEEENY
jgi:hypothetical protein